MSTTVSNTVISQNGKVYKGNHAIHTCMYCKHACRKELMGKHIAVHHPDELKAAFQRYQKVSATTTYPFIAQGGWFYCFECREWWSSREEAKAKAHYTKGKCTGEKARLRLYDYIGVEIPAAPVIPRQLEHENQILKKAIAMTKQVSEQSDELDEVKAEVDYWKKSAQLWKKKYEDLLAKSSVCTAPVIEQTAPVIDESPCVPPEAPATPIQISEPAPSNPISVMTQDEDDSDDDLEAALAAAAAVVAANQAELAKQEETKKKENNDYHHCRCGMDIYKKKVNRTVKGVIDKDRRYMFTCVCCKELRHANNDDTECYAWYCDNCDEPICMECNSKNGGNKLHPVCSRKCAMIIKEQS